MKTYRFLFVPSVRRGNGTGHVQRALNWVSQMPKGSAGVFIKKIEWRDEFSQLASAAGVDDHTFITDHTRVTSSRWDFAVLDQRATEKAEFSSWTRTGIQLIGLDEGGPKRRRFSYLIDTFPLPASFSRPNVNEPALLSLPDRRRVTEESGENDEFQNILVSFGGEDPAHLTELCTRWLIARRVNSFAKITVVTGPLFGERRLPEAVEVWNAPQNLAESLYRFDVVITSFGLTAYEAAYAGCGVVVLNPSRYHRRLGRRAGFPQVGVRRINSRRLQSWLAFPQRLKRASAGIAPEEKRSPAEFLAQLKKPDVRDCPVCGRLAAVPVVRFAERSFFRCSNCGMLYQIDFFQPGGRYNEDYFFEEYRNQYGRSYLEDFRSIKRTGIRRISIIDRIRKRSGPAGTPQPRLLDVGCAYGPFLSAAFEAGYRPEGLDVAGPAVEYVQNKLGFKAYNIAFEEFNPTENAYDVVSMWYVIEHFPSIERILRKANSLLKMGGLLALSTPNSTGISGRKSLKDFLKQSPRDHHTVWSPPVAARVLRLFGFRIRKIVVTGHHPERFPLVGSVEGNALYSKALFSTLSVFSRAARLGDTFEVYAEKVEENGRAHT